MNEQDFSEILRYLQDRMRELGLSSLNDRIVSDIRIDPGRPSTQLFRYLDALESEMRLGTEETARLIVDRMRETVETESGDHPEGLTLLLSDADRELYGANRVDLAAAPDLRSVLDEITTLRRELQQSREG